MRTVLRSVLLVSLLCILAACEPAVPAPTETPPVTTAPTSVATRTPEPVPTAFFGREIQASRNTATIRIIHAAADAPPIDLDLADAPLVSGLGYGLASNATTVIPGAYRLRVRERGTTDVLAEAEVNLSAGVATDVVVTPGASGIQLTILEGPERALEAGTSVVRAVNALSGSESVEVGLNDADTGDPLAVGAATPLLTFPEGDLDVTFGSGGAEMVSNALRLRALTNMLLVATGVPGRPRILVFETPTLSLYSLRVVNLSTDAREIDVFFDDAIVAANLAYQVATDRVVYSTAPATISVYAANADLTVSTPYLAGQRVTPTPGSTVTLAIFGPVADLRVMWIEQDVSAVPVGHSRVTFAHVLEGVPMLRVGVNSTDLEDVRAFAYGQVSEPVLFESSPLRLFLRDSVRDGAIVELHEAAQFESGQSIIYFVVGEPGEEEMPPLTYADAVEVDESLVAEPLETPAGTFHVRYVNAIASQPLINILQDSVPFASNLSFGEATPLGTVTANSVQVTAQVSGSGALLFDTRFPLERPGSYSVFIFGTPEIGFNATIIPDGTFTAGASVGTARLINLTRDPSALFSLAARPVNPLAVVNTPEPTLVPTATPEGGPEIVVGPPRLPAGMAVPVREIGTGSASRVVGIQANSLIYVINANLEIIAELRLVPFAPGTHTDIVVYEYRTQNGVANVIFPLVYAAA